MLFLLPGAMGYLIKPENAGAMLMVAKTGLKSIIN